MKHLFMFSCLLLLFSTVQAQTCDFDERLSAWKERDKRSYNEARDLHRTRINEFRNEGNVRLERIQGDGMALLQAGCTHAEFLIPVVVHVVHDNAYPGSDIQDSMVRDQIDIMNKAFSGFYGGTDTKIRFCLAQKDPNGNTITGIKHILDNNPEFNKTGDLQRKHLQSLAYYDPQKYLNIWVVPDIWANGSPSNTGGYSNIGWQVNGIQGIVMRYTLFGDQAKYSFCLAGSRGFAVAHEIGHYFGLYHIYEGGCSGGTDGTSCMSQGDLCCDTRPMNQNFNCPISPGSDCPSSYYDGRLIYNNHQNFMDYTDEACKTNFTAGQSEIMTSTLVKYYNKLISPQNLNYMNMSCCVSVAWFNADNTFMCGPDSVRLMAAQMTGGTYLWRIYKNGVFDHQYSSGNYKYNWLCSSPGTYTVQLNVLVGSDTMRLTRTDYIEHVTCGPTIASTQGNWYFGKRAGIRFTTTGAVRDLSAFNANPQTIFSDEGAVTQSDNSGNLLFYAGGDSVLFNPPDIYHLYNNSHKEVNTTKYIRGHSSASQGGIVIPRQNRPGQYYLFTIRTDGYEGAYYSVINMANANLADTFNINKKLPVPTGSDSTSDNTLIAAEQMTAIPRCDGSYWLLVVDNSSYSYANSGKVVIYKVDSAGVTYHGLSDEAILVDNFWGQMKASPDGRLVAAPGILYSFDKSLGILKKLQNIYAGGSTAYYGMSFSPDSRLLYLTEQDTNANQNLYQVDAYDRNAWANRVKLPVDMSFNFFASLQLGPDSLVYISLPGSSYVAVIRKPNRRCTAGDMNACEYVEQGVKLQDADGRGGVCKSSLPNMIDAKMETDYATDFMHIDSACFFVRFVPNKSCSGSISWSFGDGGLSSSKEPLYQYTAKGTYTVSMITGGDTVSKEIHIGAEVPVISGMIPSGCDLSPTFVYSVLNKQNYADYTWSVTGGTILDTEAPATAFVKWSTAGKLRVLATDTRTGCSEYSAELLNKYLGDPAITGNSTTCFTETAPTLTGLIPCVSDYYLIHYTWQWSTDSVSWSTISTMYGVGDWSPVAIAPVTYFRRIRTYGAYKDTSNVVVIKKQTMPTTLDNFLSPLYVSNGNTVVCNPKLNGMGILIKWQKKTRSYPFAEWTDYPVAYLDTLTFSDSDTCRKATEQYRLIYQKFCPMNGFDTAVLEVIYNYDASDIWMKDADDDSGSEPYPGVYYISTDIWVRTDLLPLPEHQTPVYVNSTTPNRVYVRVRNRGTDTSEAAKLYLYWMHSAAGAIWPGSWKYSTGNTILNPCSGPYFNQLAPLGGEINTAAVTVPRIAPGGIITLYSDWIPPNPDRYCYMGKGAKSIHVCLLARIEECGDYPHGMTSPETRHTYRNIVQNNNIISRNTAVIAGDSTISGPDTTIWTGLRPVRNQQGFSIPLNIRFYSSDIGYYNDGYVLITMDNLILTRWIEGGSMSSGLLYLGDGIFRVTNPDFVSLGNISMMDNEVGFIGFSFRPYLPMLYSMPVHYEFRLEQEEDDGTGSEVVGGVQYVLNIPSGGTWNIGGAVSVKAKEIETVKIYPNPAQNQITVNTAGMQNIYLYDITGRLLLTKNNVTADKVTIDVSDIAEGMLMVKILKTDGAYLTGRVVLTR